MLGSSLGIFEGRSSASILGFCSRLMMLKTREVEHGFSYDVRFHFDRLRVRVRVWATSVLVYRYPIPMPS